MASPNNTVISVPGQSIVDARGNRWTIVDGQVVVNGIIDLTTANVIEMAYDNGLVWQKNTDNLWWSKTTPGASWQPPYGTPVDPIPNQVASANDTIVTIVPNSPAASITDATGNSWSISNGQVTLNGIADPTTANVIEIAYVNGKVWQENTDDLWWSKSKPSDQWGPDYGTATSPVAHVARTWNGASAAFATPGDWLPGGVPQAGDTAIINSGDVLMTPGYGNGVNFALRGGELSFNASGTFKTGTWNGPGSVTIGYPGQSVTVSNTGIVLSGGELDIRPFNTTRTPLAIHGNSSVTGGAVLDVQYVGTASLPRGPIENDGIMTVNGATLEVGAVSGNGVIRATGNSSVSVLSAGSGQTIQLVSAHLYIGGGPLPGSTAMQFLAPVTSFGANSEISLVGAQATREVFTKTSPTAGELLLYNGSTKVADLHISGQSHIYASNIPPVSSPASVLLTPYDTGHSIPIASS
ncbi:MAG TPA: hypothetical protein VGC09_09815 [Rhodopila sp.]